MEKKKPRLKSSLKNYTTIALSAIAADASSQVIYNDINDSTLINNGDFFDIDLNNDGINDVSITITKSIYSYSYSSYISYVNYNLVEANGLGNNNVNIVYNTSYSINSAKAFSSNDNINSLANSWSGYGYVGGYATGYLYSPSYSTTINVNIGQFPGQGDKYLGVRFNIGANTHYGWVRLDVSALSDTVIIKDFAFDTAANAAILAGDTGTTVGIDKINENSLSIYSQSNRIILQEAISNTSEVRVYSLSGKLIERRRLLANQNELSLSKEYQGIYIIEVNYKENVFRKKLWLDSTN